MPGLRSLIARRRATLPSTPLTPPIDILAPAPKSAEPQLSISSDPPDWSINNGLYFSTPTPPDESGNYIDKMEDNTETTKTEGILSDPKAVDTATDLSWLLAKSDDSSMLNVDQCSDHTVGKDSGYGFLNSNDECSSPADDLQNASKSHKKEETISGSCSEKCVNDSPPERIVIKMKLLHQTAFKDDDCEKLDDCDITYIESNNEKEPGLRSKYTRWTIDTIINAPVESIKKEPVDEQMEDEEWVSNEKPDHTNERTNFVDSNSNLMSDRAKCQSKNDEDLSTSDSFKSDGESLNGKSIKLYFGKSLISKNIVGLHNIKEPSDENVPYNDRSSSPTTSETDQSSLESTNNSRRQSHCSDTSSDCDPTMKMKPCSLVLKRVENSDCYSCIRTNKKESNDDKKTKNVASCRPKRRAAVIASEKCLITLTNFDARKPSLKQKKNIHENKMSSQVKPLFKDGSKINKTNVQCSVVLCDVFKNQSLYGLVCPGCCQPYDAQNDAVINLGEKTLSLECVKCNWLVVRSLVQKEISAPTFNINSNAFFRTNNIQNSR